MLTPASRSTLQIIAAAGDRFPMYLPTRDGGHARNHAEGGFYAKSLHGLLACEYVEKANDASDPVSFEGYRVTAKGLRVLEALAAVDAIRAAPTAKEKWSICKAATRAARG